MSRCFCFPLLLAALIAPPLSANPAVFEAAAEGNAAELRRLVSEDPSLLRARDSIQRTPLHAAAEAGGVEAVQALLDAGADPSARDRKGATPLHLAAWKGRLAVAELLIARGGDVQAADCYSRTPLAWALLSGKREMAEFLRSRMARPDIFSACRLGEKSAIKTLLREDPSLLRRADEAGNTPLHWAVLGWWQAETVRLLLSRGADLSARNVSGETPLMLAERIYAEETLAEMRRYTSRRQRQAWGWASVIAAAIAGGRFCARRRRKRNIIHT